MTGSAVAPTDLPPKLQTISSPPQQDTTSEEPSVVRKHGMVCRKGSEVEEHSRAVRGIHVSMQPRTPHRLSLVMNSRWFNLLDQFFPLELLCLVSEFL